LGKSSIWAITSYYNPASYWRRRGNYSTFREHLKVPLVAIELSYTGHYELTADDADILVQLQGSAVLWQKERLLNIALSHLPPECRQVAWLDCDVVFEPADWAAAAVEELKRVTFCQLFKTVYHLAPDVPLDKRFAFHSSGSFAYGFATGASLGPGMVGKGKGFRRGHAWAADRQLLDVLGLYDRSIIGGGDRVMAFAMIGRAESLISSTAFSPAHAEDYRCWAKKCYAIGSRVGYVDVDLLHLWHGDLDDRRYEGRHSVLVAHDYDPKTDIALNTNGCWRWNSDKPAMHRSVREYFDSRMEDGRAAHLVAGGVV
jgi:hypothetical protein